MNSNVNESLPPPCGDSSVRSHDYAAVPPLLISATGLESYLGSLSRQLGRDMGKIKQELDTSALEVAQTQKSVNDMKRFLTVSAKERMEALLEATTEAERRETEEQFQVLFANPGNVSDTDVFPCVLSLAKRLMSDNARLRTTLEASTVATRNFLENQEQLKQQLAEMNYRMKCYQRDFHELSLWLGTYDAEKQATKSFPSAAKSTASKGNPSGQFDSYELAGVSDAELEGTVSQSPLLLAFRRILLRDMVDRVTHQTDMQAREVGGVVAGLHEDIHQRVTPERVVDLLESRQTSDAQVLVANYAKRLKEIEDAYVSRDEFATIMKSKADTMLLPVKADSAVVTSLERRVFDKYAELEERVAYFEAEREEFRNVVRSLVSLQQQHQVVSMAPPATDRAAHPSALATASATGKGNRALLGNGSGAGKLPPAAAQVHLGEVLTTTRTKEGSGGPTDPREAAAGEVTADAIGGDLSGKTIYRVIGADRATFAVTTTAVSNPAADIAGQGSSKAAGGWAGAAHSATASSLDENGVSRKAAAPAQQRRLAGTTKSARVEATKQGTPPPSAAKDGGREFVPMTANQVAYAHLVSGELSREDVQKLPVLPYEPAC